MEEDSLQSLSPSPSSSRKSPQTSSPPLPPRNPPPPPRHHAYIKVLNPFPASSRKPSAPSRRALLTILLLALLLFTILAALFLILLFSRFALGRHQATKQSEESPVNGCECARYSTTTTTTDTLRLSRPNQTGFQHVQPPGAHQDKNHSYINTSAQPVSDYEKEGGGEEESDIEIHPLPDNPSSMEDKANLSMNLPNQEEETTENPTTQTQFFLNEESSSSLPSPTEALSFIRSMARDSWTDYHQTLWPSRKMVHNSSHLLISRTGQYLLASLSTLSVMNLTEELTLARSWIERRLDFAHIEKPLSVHLIVNDFIGGLLSAGALTRDGLYAEKAESIARQIGPAYNRNTGLPSATFKPLTDWVQGSTSVPLPEMTSQLLIYAFLYTSTHSPVYLGRLSAIETFLRTRRSSVSGLYGETANPSTGNWTPSVLQLGAGNALASHLLKRYLQSSRTDLASWRLFNSLMDAYERNRLLRVDKTSGLVFAHEDDLVEYMLAEGCSLGATLGLAAKELQQESHESDTSEHERHLRYRSSRYMDLAEQITEQCHRQTQSTRTRLTPRRFFFEPITPGNVSLFYGNTYQGTLAPHLAESYFTLWRLTHDPKYRRWAWQLAVALHRHARGPSGRYSTLVNVNRLPAEQEELLSDGQMSHFISGTLKFLYLTFTEDTVLPLDSWIFTQVGHPLPVAQETL